MSNALTFIKNGMATFRSASQGHYDYMSDELKALRKDMFLDKLKSDKENLYSDRKSIEKDFRRAFNKVMYE
jgi:hypothetical protein